MYGTANSRNFSKEMLCVKLMRMCITVAELNVLYFYICHFPMIVGLKFTKTEENKRLGFITCDFNIMKPQLNQYYPGLLYNIYEV